MVDSWKNLHQLICLVLYFFCCLNFLGAQDAEEVNIRGGLPNFFHKIQNGETITIGYLGGSITRADGYRIFSVDWLKEEYNNPNVSGINAGIGGTGSPLGVFRIQEGVLDYNPDLVFIEFAVNDGNPSNTATIKKAMEGMVRQIWNDDPTTEICFIYTIKDDYLSDLQNDTYPIAAAAHDEVAAHYNIPSIHLGLEVAKMAERGELIFEKSSGVDGDGYDENGNLVFSKDGVHPTLAGHGLYRDAIARSFRLMEENNIPVNHILGNPHLTDNWEDARMLDVSDLSLTGITQISQATHPTYFGDELKFYTQLGSLLLGEETSDEISFTFEGRMVGMWDPKGPRRGDILTQVDQEAAFKLERFDGFSHFWRDNYILLDELEPGEHTVSFKVHPERPDKRAILNNKSEYDDNPSLFDGEDMVIGRILVLGVGNTQQIGCENTYSVNAGQNQTLDCESGTATLIGQTNASSYEWLGPDNELISQNLQINVTQAGNYTFVGVGDENCRVEDQVIVNPCIDCSEPVIDQIKIIDSNEDESIGILEDGGFINIFDYPGGLNLDAEVSSCPDEVGSIRFEMTGDESHSRTESKAPYAFAGDSNGDYRDFFFTPGNYTLTVTPYSESGTNGTAGTPLVINFTVINQEIDPCEILPTVGITGDPNLTCLTTETTLTASASEEGTYAWTGPNGFSANTVAISVSLPGIYEVTFRSSIGCEVAKAIVVSISELPTLTVNKSGDLLCSGGSVTLSASSNQNGTYTWVGPNNFTASGESISVDQAGGYTATFLSEAGCQLSRSISVEQEASPEITIDGDPRVSCSGTSTTLTASTVEQGSFNWTGPDNFSSTGPSVIISIPGTYEVSFVSVDNCESSKQVEVFSLGEAFVFAGEDVALSCQTFSTTLTATSNEEGEFYWTGPNNFESTSQQITVNEAGEYIVYFTNPIGCENLDIVNVFPAVIPVISLPENVDLPCNEEGVSLIAESNTEGSYRWSGSHDADGGQSTLYVTLPGTYSVEFTSWDGCITSAQTVVDSVEYDPIVELDRTATINCEGSPADFSIVLEDFCGVHWTGPDGFSSTELKPEIVTAGEYTLLVNNKSACEARDTINVVEEEFSPVSSIPEQVSWDCGANSTTIQVVATNYDSLSWSGPDGFESSELSPQISASGTYILSMFSGTGCIETYEVEAVDLSESYTPIISIETETELSCATGSAMLMLTATDFDSFIWVGPNEFSSDVLTPEVSLSGIYTITFLKGAYCEASYQITVSPKPDYAPIISIPETVDLDCLTDEAQIVVVADPYDGVLWTGAGGFTSSELSPTVSAPGEYNLTLTYGTSCDATAMVNVISGDDVYDPVSSIPTTLSISCREYSVQIPVTAEGYSTVLWEGPNGFSSDQLSPFVSEQGTYTLTLFAGSFCTAEYEIQLLEDNAPYDPVLSIPTTVDINCDTETATIEVTATDYSSFTWTGPGNFASNSLLINPTVPGIYTITFFQGASCEASYSVTVNECIPEPTCEEPAVGDVILVNADTDQDLFLLQDGMTINLYDFPNPLNIYANPEICPTTLVRSMRMVMTGALEISRTESTAPFALGGDNGGNFRPITFLTGNYQLVVTPYSERGARGTAGQSRVINFTIINHDIDPCEEDPPSVEAGENVLLACDGTPSQITAVASEAGSFSWSGPNGFSASSASISITSPGTYTVLFTDLDNCTTSDQVSAALESPASVSIDQASAAICEGKSIDLSATANGSGTFSWSGPDGFSATEASITVSLAGTYTLTFTNDAGCTASDAITVEDLGTPSVSIAQQSPILCEGSLLTLSISNPDAQGSYSWTGPDNFIAEGTSVEISAAGTYSVSYLSAAGCEATDEITVTEEALPIVNVENELVTICEGESASLSATSTQSGTYSWTGPNGYTASGASITVSAAGTYTVTFTNENGCENTDQSVVEYLPTASVSAGNDQILACAGPGVTLTATANGAGSFSWTGPNNFTANTAEINVSEIGVYSVSYINTSGCEATDVVNVTPAPLPTVDAGDDISPFCDELPVTLSPTLGSGNLDVLWTGPANFSSTETNPQVTEAGTYLITVTNEYGCTSTDQLTLFPCEEQSSCEEPSVASVILVDSDTDEDLFELRDGMIINLFDTPNPLNIYALREECSPNLVRSMRFVLTGAMDLSRTESSRPFALGGDSRGDYRPIIFETGEYQLTVTAFSENSGGGIAGTPKVINFIIINQEFDPCENGIPTVEAGEDIELACNESNAVFNATASEAGSFSWTGPSGFTANGASITVSTVGTYILTFTNQTGCSVTDRIELTKAAYNPFISIPSSLILPCESTGVSIQVSLGDHTTVSWTGPYNFSSTTISPIVSLAGTYMITVSNAEGCEDSRSVTVQNGTYDPVISLPALVDLDCESNTASIPLSIGAYESLLWTGPDNFQSTEESISVTESGVYTLTVTSQVGCIQVYEVVVDPCETECIVSAVRQIILVNADNDQDVMEIQDGTTINLGQLGHNIAIRVEEESCSFEVKSVRMVMTGEQNQSRTESKAPWALFGDSNGNFAAWEASPGTYNLIATPYSERGARGVPGVSKEVSFNITNAQQGNRSFSSLNEVEELIINKAYLAPNRTSRHTQLHVEGELNGPVGVTIFNTLGSKIVELSLEKSSTKQVYPLVLPHMAEGIYWVQISYAQQQFSARLLIDN